MSGAGQELVAGGDEVGDVAGGVGSAGTGDIGVHGAQTTGERGADGGGVGARGHPEAGGRVHDLPIMPSPREDGSRHDGMQPPPEGRRWAAPVAAGSGGRPVPKVFGVSARLSACGGI